jgi:hypothetical protein
MKPQPVERLEKTLARVAKEQDLAQSVFGAGFHFWR